MSLGGLEYLASACLIFIEYDIYEHGHIIDVDFAVFVHIGSHMVVLREGIGLLGIAIKNDIDECRHVIDVYLAVSVDVAFKDGRSNRERSLEGHFVEVAAIDAGLHFVDFICFEVIDVKRKSPVGV